jgi:hypothetical protein
VLPFVLKRVQQEKLSPDERIVRNCEMLFCFKKTLTDGKQIKTDYIE